MPMNGRLLRPRASGAFNPKSVSGLAAWWDADDSTTITLNGSTVSEWRDKSGNGRNLTQATAANQPTYSTNEQNGKPAIIFANASSRFLSYSSGMFSFTGAGTVFIATKTVSRDTNDFGSFISEGTGVTARTFVALAPGVFGVAGFRPATDIYGPHGRRTTTTYTGTSPQVLQWQWENWSTHRSSGTIIGVSNDGVDTESYGSSNPLDFTNDTRQFRVGVTGTSAIAAACLNATVCEILAYTAVLSASQRSAARRYLARKWGITST